jgi:uncharacterized membrane protein YjgN (DUF898 family)
MVIRSDSVGTVPQSDGTIAAGPREPAATTEFVRHPVEFTGTTGDYFRIWIVNLALTIVTLGIYSAWAKVRRRRYLYGNTHVEGEVFEYRAKPLPILKGRLIALALLIAVFATGHFVPVFSAQPLLRNLALVVGFVLFGPWVIVRSFKFNAYNTAYRNVRLRFGAEYRDCLRVVGVYGWLLLMPILYPYLKRRLVLFVATNHYYGTTQFAVDKPTFWTPFLKAYNWPIVFGIIGGIAFAIGTALVASRHAGGGIQALSLAILYASLLAGLAYLRAKTANVLWNSLSIGPIRFQSTLKPGTLVAMYFTNLAAIVATAGLAIPWAVIRTHRYRASKTIVVAAGSLDGFVQGEAVQAGATGEEVGEMFDLDIAF